VKRRKRKPRVSPYRRLEAELRFARGALSDAAAQYSRALQALIDLLEFFDRQTLDRDSIYTDENLVRIAEIREIANGKL
jgi:hypothetical protein